jgi:hypothetical protein
MPYKDRSSYILSDVVEDILCTQLISYGCAERVGSAQTGSESRFDGFVPRRTDLIDVEIVPKEVSTEL